MIFILTEQIMNGTVTMSVITTGIEAESFEKAVEKIKKTFIYDKYVTLYEKLDGFSYTTDGDFPVFGNLDNKPLQII